MTTISSITDYTVSLENTQKNSPPPPPPGGEPLLPPDQDGTQATSGHRPHGGGLEKAVLNTLSQVGLTLPGNSSDSENSTTTDNDGDTDDTSSQSGIQADVQSFIRNLFQAMREQNQGSTVNSDGNPYSTTVNPSSTFSADLTSLISETSSGTSSNDTSIQNLQSSFTNLISDISGSGLSGTTSSDQSGTLPTLTDFLEKLKGNIPLSGGFTHTVA